MGAEQGKSASLPGKNQGFRRDRREIVPLSLSKSTHRRLSRTWERCRIRGHPHARGGIPQKNALKNTDIAGQPRNQCMIADERWRNPGVAGGREGRAPARAPCGASGAPPSCGAPHCLGTPPWFPARCPVGGKEASVLTPPHAALRRQGHGCEKRRVRGRSERGVHPLQPSPRRIGGRADFFCCLSQTAGLPRSLALAGAPPLVAWFPVSDAPRGTSCVAVACEASLIPSTHPVPAGS